MPSQKRVPQPFIGPILARCLPLIALVATPCQAAFDLAPYFALNPGNQLTYRHQCGSGDWEQGENAVIGGDASFNGTTAKRRIWSEPSGTCSETSTSTEYLNVTATEICIYGASSTSGTTTQTLLFNPASPGTSPQGVCFPRNVDLGANYPRTFTLQILGGSYAGTYPNASYTITIPNSPPPLAGASSTVYITNGLSFSVSSFPVTRNSQSWLAYGTGLLKRTSSGMNNTTPITTETSEITAFTPAAGSVCKTDALIVNTTTFNTTTFGTGTHNWTSNASIITQGSVTLPAGANVTFRSPLLQFKSGFRVAGGTFKGQIGTSVCPTATSLSQPAVTTTTSIPAVSNLAVGSSLASPQVFATLDQLPAWVRDRLDPQGIDTSMATQLMLDGNGQWLLFQTTQDLVAADTNGMSDIYRLDLVNDTLSLISRTPQGWAGNGPSRYPAADALGNWVAFQSDADDLTQDDTNGVTDIFLYDLLLGQVQGVTADAEAASAHPALDTAGDTLAYDQQDEAGFRHILAVNPWITASSERVSLLDDDLGMPLDNHHPALSADGRFIAYIEGGAADQPDRCQVHFFDRDSGHFQRQPCPAAIAAASEKARPMFSTDGAWLEWAIEAEPIVLMFNPLGEGGAGQPAP